MLLPAIDTLERNFRDRIIPIGEKEVGEWARLLGGRNKDRWDLALAATARVNGFVVTRNLRIFRGAKSL